jgi:hypothetical protein
MKLSRIGLVLVGALLVPPLAVMPASGAPATGVFFPGIIDGVGLSTTASGQLDLFYPTGSNTLAHRRGTVTEDLGGAVLTGADAITIGSEFASTWTFVLGNDAAVWFRQFSDGRGTWGPWTSAGGRSFTRPAVSCSGDATAQPTLYAQGTDRALWTKAQPNGRWVSLGGQLITGPGAVSALAGVCPSEQDVFGIGLDKFVWEFRGGRWTRLAIKSFDAPTALRLPDGGTDVYAIGLDGALWVAHRPAGSAVWSPFSRAGGNFLSAPAVQLLQTSAAAVPQRIVMSIGTNLQLYQATSPVRSSTWRISRVP